MNVTESQLATALEGFYIRVHAPVGGEPVTARLYDADGFAAALYATLSRMAALRDEPCHTDPHIAHQSCPGVPHPVSVDTVPVGTDPELSAIAALIPALPLVARLGYDARERVMDWATRRATDGLAPF